jgi:TCP-1/cpn60 chaperonin family
MRKVGAAQEVGAAMEEDACRRLGQQWKDAPDWHLRCHVRPAVGGEQAKSAGAAQGFACQGQGAWTDGAADRQTQWRMLVLVLASPLVLLALLTAPRFTALPAESGGARFSSSCVFHQPCATKVADIEAAERSKMREKVEKIISHGINCFVNRQLIYNFPEEIFADAGVMAIEHADFDGIERLALVTGGAQGRSDCQADGLTG